MLLIKSVVILPDVHVTQDGYSPVYQPVKNFIAAFEPDICILLGDFVECRAYSMYDEKKIRNRENSRYDLECKEAKLIPMVINGKTILTLQ